MTTDNPQVPWTDEQWARVNKAVQEEASRVRIAATFLPLLGPLPGDTDFVRRERIPPDAMTIQDRRVIQLATLQVRVTVRGAQMADPEMTSVLALFRRAASVLARLEDAVVFRGLVPDPANKGPDDRFAPPISVGPRQRVWEITGGQESRGLWTIPHRFSQVPEVDIAAVPLATKDARLVVGVAQAIGLLEAQGHFGPFAVVLDQALFLVAQTPSPALVLAQDRILPFLGGGPLLRSSTLNAAPGVANGVVVALGGEPVELVIATDVCVQFLQVTAEPNFVFRVCEKMALRIKEPEAIVRLID
ncbi:bacteriocin family protein [Bradyrhizobium barranii subsp. barranii]|uniref:Bacteriocin family protein n=1 Tax=Bradyrhizobium barranii subsp. barranii TaxID=2823807 RepID=A0A939M9J6_9BRAD|nr:family 1 encapsulin nanocompartment shell protein [Bradyrhizobium barranii]UEM14986.1 bacteriocin family protein [Bradyrhizobium barranii subsp. barranii]